MGLSCLPNEPSTAATKDTVALQVVDQMVAKRLNPRANRGAAGAGTSGAGLNSVAQQAAQAAAESEAAVRVERLARHFTLSVD